MEVIGHGEVSTGSDVYTLAMLFYEFYMALCGTELLQCRPFSKMHPSRILSHLQDGNIPDRPENCPKWLYDKVMKPCWDQDRTCRPTATEILTIITEYRPVREYYENPTIQEDTNSSFDEISLEIQTEHTDTSKELYDRFILGTSQQLDTNFIDEKNCETNDSSDEEYCEVTSIEKRSSPGDDSKTEDQCGQSRYVNFPDKQTKEMGGVFQQWV